MKRPHINKMLKLLRIYHQMRLADLAEKFGTSCSYISSIELGRRGVSLNLLDKYSEIFDIPPSWILCMAEVADDFIDGTKKFHTEHSISKLESLSEWLKINKCIKQHSKA